MIIKVDYTFGINSPKQQLFHPLLETSLQSLNLTKIGLKHEYKSSIFLGCSRLNLTKIGLKLHYHSVFL